MKKLSVILFMALAIFVMSGNVAAKDYCFCMGLSKCNTPGAEDISSAQYDAIDFKKALAKQGFKGSVIVNQYATRENILKRVKNVVAAAKSPNDKIVLFFATHGHDDGFRPRGHAALSHCRAPPCRSQCRRPCTVYAWV